MNTGLEGAHVICGFYCWSSQFLSYCFNCPNSQNCFGCVGLRKGKYSILNKEYDKDTYEKITADIIAELKAQGIYGEFFPKEFSAFGYNETSAQAEFPLAKDQALAQGFSWEETPRGTYGRETIAIEDMPDAISEYSGDIAKEIFVCHSCDKNFRVIPNELSFYKKLSVPLPRRCPDCRHERRIRGRGPNKLWHRSCMNTGCTNEFETSYAPDRPEIVYCESCYQREVI